MKKSLFLSMAFFSVGTAAFAQGHLECQSLNRNVDDGYSAIFSADQDTVVIWEASVAGPRKLAKLDCVRPALPGSNGPDQLQVDISCTGTEQRDGGYSLVVSHGGFGGLTLATLSEESLGGPKTIATLPCKQK